MSKSVSIKEVISFNFCPVRFHYDTIVKNEMQTFREFMIEILRNEYHKLIEVKSKGSASVKLFKYTEEKFHNTLIVASDKAKASGNVKLPTDKHMDKLLKTFMNMASNFYNSIYQEIKILSPSFETTVPTTSGSPLDVSIDFTAQNSKNNTVSAFIIDYTTSERDIGGNRPFLYHLAAAYHLVSGTGHKISTIDSIDLRVYRAITNEIIKIDKNEMINLMPGLDNIVNELRDRKDLTLYHRFGIWCDNICPHFVQCTEDRKVSIKDII